MSGPVLHTLVGMARVLVDEVEYEETLERMTGRWEDSFEADQVVALYGPVEWTACWVLTGFASGYASESTDRDMLCVERECRARGDDVCRFEILPAASFPGLARKVEALRRGMRLKERMKPTITRLWEKAFTSSAYLARILRDSADAILTVDEDEVIQTWNRGAEELFGYAPDEAVGRHFRFLVPQDLRERGEIEKIRRETVDHGSLRNYGTRRLRKDGQEVEVSLTRTSIHDANGRYIGASAILRDVTERKRLVEQLIQAESLAEVGELAAQVAHEIKNPLAGISGAIQVLADGSPPGDPRAEIFTEILDHIRRLDRTVLSLLEYTRPYRPTKAPTDLNLLLDSALSQLRDSEVFTGVTVERHITPGAAQVCVDSQQFIQVLLNLLLNAAQAARDDRRIRVVSRREGKRTILHIEDHGEGIGPEKLRQIFRTFFTTRHHGTGLGLAVARKIIEAHGGTIRVSSVPGVMTRFSILLPTE